MIDTSASCFKIFKYWFAAPIFPAKTWISLQSRGDQRTWNFERCTRRSAQREVAVVQSTRWIVTLDSLLGWTARPQIRGLTTKQSLSILLNQFFEFKLLLYWQIQYFLFSIFFEKWKRKLFLIGTSEFDMFGSLSLSLLEMVCDFSCNRRLCNVPYWPYT